MREGQLFAGRGVVDSSEADRDAVEAKEDVWSTSGEIIYHHHVMPREHLYVPKESSFPFPSEYIEVARETKTNLDNVEESSIDDLWSTDGIGILYESWSGSTGIPHPKQAPTPRFFMDGW